MPARPWTDRELDRAGKLLASGMSKYDIDRYFGRRLGATEKAFRTRRLAPVERIELPSSVLETEAQPLDQTGIGTDG